MTRRSRSLLLCLGAGLLTSGPVLAYQLNETTIIHDAGHYHVSFDMQLAADSTRVRALMSDYDHLDRLSPIVTQSHLLQRFDDGRRRIRLDVRACVWFLCKTVRRVQDVTLLADGDITTTAIPELSDFSHAEERWRIEPLRQGTHIHYRAELVPSFFVPPMLGPYLMKQAIRRELLTAAERLERLAGAAGGDSHLGR